MTNVDNRPNTPKLPWKLSKTVTECPIKYLVNHVVSISPHVTSTQHNSIAISKPSAVAQTQ